MTSSLFIVFERLQQEQIVEFLHNECCYSETQFSFQNNYSTIDALSFCSELLRLVIDNYKLITAARPDLSKAFDSIKQYISKEKLISMSFS